MKSDHPLKLKFITLAALLISLALIPGTSLPASAAQLEDTSKLSYDARLTKLDYGMEVSFHKLSSQGQQLEMAYSLLKGKAAMPVITLLHGKNFNAAYWRETATYLNRQGYTVLIPDQIGFGKSSKPTAYQYSFASLAAHTKSLMDALGFDKSVILGHSMGGMLATRFAIQYPEATTKLILLNPIGLENYLNYVSYKDTDFFAKIEAKKTAESIRAYQRKNYYDGNWNAKYDALTHFMIGQIQGPDSEKIAWVNALTYDMIFTQPVVTEFKNLTVPTTLILGTRDRTGPGRNWKRPGVTRELGRYDRLGEEAQKLIKEAELIRLEEIGHLPHIENFEKFTAALAQALPDKAGQ